jgi:hypothetical protein
LEREHPLVAFRDCESCKKWLYDEKTGMIHTRNGVNSPRGNVPTPCDEPKLGCHKGHYDKQMVLSDRNQMAYQHFKECKAVGQFPDDSVVRRNASIISALEENYERDENYRVMTSVVAAGSMFGGKK